MFSFEFDDNPFAEEIEVESQACDGYVGGAGVKKRERDVEDLAEGEPRRKMARRDDAAGEDKEAEVEFAAPYIGYSLEDEEGGEENGDTDETYLSFLCRVAEMEAALRQSARVHHFRMTLAEHEKEALRISIASLRSSLMGTREKRQKASQSTTEAGSAEKDAESRDQEGSLDLAALLNVCVGASKLKRLNTHFHLLQSLEKFREHATKEDRATSVESESWMPTASDVEVEAPSSQLCNTEMKQFDDIRRALEKVQDRFDGPIAPVVIALQNEIQRLCSKSDALSEVKGFILSQRRAAMARWNKHVLWATERALLVADEQMRSHLSALSPSLSGQQLIRQHQQLQKRLHRAEVALATLLAAATGTQLKSVMPATLQATLRRQQELENLRHRLSREILYLRKLLREKLGKTSLLVCDLGSASHETATAEEGKTILLRHCCAAIAQRLAEVTQQIISEVVKGSTACAVSAEQDERQMLYEAKTGTLHTSIVAFLAENARLEQEIKDAALIKLMVSPGSAAVMLLVERLQTLLHCKLSVEQEQRQEEDTDRNEKKRDNKGQEESVDEQGLLVDIFMESTAGLLKVLNEHLSSVSTLFKGEQRVFREAAFLLRMTVAADRLLLGKVGVPLSASFTDDPAKEMDEAHVRFKPLQNGLQQLPSLETIREEFQSHSRRHAAYLLAQYGEAEKTRKELQEDVEWCRKQCTKNAATVIGGAQKELQSLKTSLSAAVAREKEVVSLEAELVKSREQLVQLRHERLVLEKELFMAEEQWRLAQEAEAKENEGETEAKTHSALPPLEVAETDNSINVNEVVNDEENEAGNFMCSSECRAEETEKNV
ncbi:hypothetical protein TraAM80_04110 [Trypanosoma rangeli]|uniref:Uncharacterized protein n=1 Tax=Trypanosoma rangeli TaxID=5698 RepID=A0A3R7LZ43_TRYRA|nr:uncharacterized protein TraAM80_04110 [Trypanosoma rangeli]RNF06114.1 hypothetical protein TraAM80_04110 [Trypanosoma rangeli]|eukprot:RNF06114.1 hypothetical protein TraAM80_04110 [Trypanosoma rangeli]